MAIPADPASSADIGTFFDFLWGQREGHAILCVGEAPRMENGKLKHDDFTPLAFQWPGGKRALIDAAVRAAQTCDVYAAVNLFERGSRKAKYALPTDLLWADDVTGSNDRMTLVDSGGGKPDSRQGYIRLAEQVDAEKAAELSRAVFASFGNPEGFDAARVLRVPGTFSHKTDPPTPVAWLQRSDVVVPLADLPAVEVESASSPSDAEPLRELDVAALSARHPGAPFFIGCMLKDEPGEDRSGQLKELVEMCCLFGMSEAETLAAALLYPPARSKHGNSPRGDRAILKDARRLIGKERERQPVAGAEAAPATFRTVTVTEFASVREPGADPILGERGQVVLPKGGDLIYHGPGGAGKSGVSLDLAFHLAAGRGEWLGIPIPKPVPVLIVENEGPRPPLRDRMEEKLRGWPTKPELLHILEDPWGKVTLQSEAHRAALADRIADLDAAVLMIGPLARVGMDTAGTLQDVWAFQQLIQDVRERAGVNFACHMIHHDNKAGSASGAWEGATETDWQSPKLVGAGRVKLYMAKVRWSSNWHGETLDLLWDDFYGYRLEDPRDLVEEVRDYMATKATWQTLKELSVAMHVEDERLRPALENSQFVMRTGAGATAVGRHPTAKVYGLLSDDLKARGGLRPVDDPEAVED